MKLFLLSSYFLILFAQSPQLTPVSTSRQQGVPGSSPSMFSLWGEHQCTQAALWGQRKLQLTPGSGFVGGLLSSPPKTLHFVNDKANISFLRENAERAPPGSTAQKFTRVAIIYIYIYIKEIWYNCVPIHLQSHQTCYKCRQWSTSTPGQSATEQPTPSSTTWYI